MADRNIGDINKALRRKALAEKRMAAIKAAGTPPSEQAGVFQGNDKATMNEAIMKGEEYADQMQKPSQEEMDSAMDKMLEKDLKSGESKTTKSWRYKGK